MIHRSDRALSEMFLMMWLRMFSFQMMIEKLIYKKKVPGTKRVTELCCFLGFCFLLFFFFFKECAGCLYNFVQMTAEPGKAVNAINS